MSSAAPGLEALPPPTGCTDQEPWVLSQRREPNDGCWRRGMTGLGSHPLSHEPPTRSWTAASGARSQFLNAYAPEDRGHELILQEVLGHAELTKIPRVVREAPR